MTEYISKSALVEEIQRRRKEWRYGSSTEAKFKREECDDILSFLDTLEVKDVQEEPVSNDLEEVATKYAQDKYLPVQTWKAFKAGAKWGMEQAEVKIQAQSIAVAHGCSKESLSNDLEEAARKIATRHSRITGDTYYANDAWFFKKGAQWQKEQFEKNRLEHCDSITEEQYNLECGFIDQYLKKYHRTPTFLDAIEYGMKKQREISYETNN